MNDNRQFVVIKDTDLNLIDNLYTKVGLFRSIENYLEKYKRDYVFNDNTCTVYVSDKLDALELGHNFKLKSIEYFNGIKSQTIDLKPKRSRVRLVQYMNTDGQKITKRDFLASRVTEKKFITVNHILRSELIRRKVFTKKQLDKLVNEMILIPISYQSKDYFNKDSIMRGLKYLSESIISKP